MKSPSETVTLVTWAAAFAPVPKFVSVTETGNKLVFWPTVVSENPGLPKIPDWICGPPLAAPTPTSVAEAGVVSLSASVTVAVRVPGAAGVNPRFTKQVACGASVKAGPQLPALMTNSDALGPVTLNPVTFSVPPPVFFTNMSVFKVSPTVVASRAGIVRTANGPVDTVPVSASTCGELGAVLGTVSVAVRVPVAEAAGVKVTLTRHSEALTTHCVSSTLNSAAFGPESTGAAVVVAKILLAPAELELSAAVCATLATPGCCPGNESVAGTNEVLVVSAFVPPISMVCGAPGASSRICTVAPSFPTTVGR